MSIFSGACGDFTKAFTVAQSKTPAPAAGSRIRIFGRGVIIAAIKEVSRCFVRIVKNGKKNDVVLEKAEFKPPFDTFTLFSSKTNIISMNPYIRGLTEDMLPDEKRKEIEAGGQRLLDSLANTSEDARREFLVRCSYIFGKDFDKIFTHEIKPAA